MHDMGSHISTEEPADSVSGAEALLAKHNEHKAEVDARQESMSQINKNGKKLIQQGHYASTEVQESLIIVIYERLKYGGWRVGKSMTY
jgi:spectrin beta